MSAAVMPECDADILRVDDEPSITAWSSLSADMLAAGDLRIETYDGFSEESRLIGPVIAVGHCMGEAGLPPGAICFADPSLPVHGGDTVLVQNFMRGGGAIGIVRAASIKILERLARGQWWLRGSDGKPPVALHSSISIVGRVVLSLHLSDASRTVTRARRESERVYAAIPPDYEAEAALGAADAIRELQARSEVDRTEYPSRPIVGALFWRTIGLPSTAGGFPLAAITGRN